MKNRNLSIIITVLAISLTASACNKAQAPADDQSSNQQQSTKTFLVEGKAGETALDALQDKYDVSVKEQAGRGKYAESIEGTTPDSNHFWAFYVNGQPSLVGAGQYTAKDGDKFEFRLEEIPNDSGN